MVVGMPGEDLSFPAIMMREVQIGSSATGTRQDLREVLTWRRRQSALHNRDPSAGSDQRSLRRNAPGEDHGACRAEVLKPRIARTITNVRGYINSY